MLSQKKITDTKNRIEQVRKTIAQMEADSERENYEARMSLKEELMYLEMIVERHKDYIDKLTRECNLGRRFINRTFENFQIAGNRQAFLKAREYVDNFEKAEGQGILFIGNAGTGKTHLAAAIVSHLIREKSVPAIFITAIELFGLLRDFDNQKERLKKIKNVPLLVLDDLGKEKITDWNREKLFEIVNARYEDYLSIIITTNDNPRELECNVGEAIYSRLCEMCSLVVMKGKDFRRQQ